jgi:hypothetical protein
VAFIENQIKEIDILEDLDVTSGLLVGSYNNVNFSSSCLLNGQRVERVDRTSYLPISKELLYFFVPLIG